jgi:dTDP-glucose pyrophosphorylase
LKNWTKILLKPNDTLETTIQVLHAGGKRIALVVDENRKLLGTVTDGDIRLALIKNIGMDCSVHEVMNSSPLTALALDPSDLIMSIMKSRDLLSIPLVDKQGILVGLETLQHLLEKREYDNPVFLMAGGFGTRLHPLTEKKPKPLLKVGNRPILETSINQFAEAGFHNIYISTHYKAEMIRDHFGDGSNWDIKIEYLYEEIPLGTAGALGLLPDNMPDLPIIMMNGDILSRVNFECLLDFHHEQNCLATMCIREYDFKVPYGVVNIEEQYVTGIVEKPIHKFFVNAGIYVLDPKIIKHVDGLTHLDMPNLLESQIENSEKVSVYPIHEYWLDIGQMNEYENAQQAFESEFV